VTVSVDPMIGRVRRLIVALGIFGVAAGIVLLVWPGATVTVLAVILGIHFLIGGLITTAGAIATPGDEKLLGVVAGLISVAAGALTLARPLQAAAFLLVIAGAFWVIRGVADLLAGILGRGDGSRMLMVGTGLISLGAGIAALAWPDATLTVLVRIAGIWMILLGLGRVAVGRSLPRA
jgi:uncharacterized membrane protein HdeD (DUF308 family)